MTSRTRFLHALLIAVALTLLIGAVALHGIRSLQVKLERVVNVNMQRLVLASQVRDELLTVNADIYRLLNWIGKLDGLGIAQEKAAINRRLDGAARHFRRLGQQAADKEQEALLAVEAGLHSYQKSIDTTIDQSRADVMAGAGMALAARTIFVGVSRQLNQMVASCHREAALTLAQAHADAERATFLVLMLTGLAMAGSLVLAWRMGRIAAAPDSAALPGDGNPAVAGVSDGRRRGSSIMNFLFPPAALRHGPDQRRRLCRWRSK